jgi:uncharacterized protein YqjF (DUF2071 family)
MASNFLTAEWRKLVMAQYEVAPGVLAEALPQGVELDLYQGRCFVSLVGFLFQRVRLKGIAIPFHTRFEEVNLRFYVRRLMADGSVRRGVVFLSEMVPKPAITLVARALYGEAYSTAATRHTLVATDSALRVGYEWKHRGAWQSMRVEAEPGAQPIARGSMEEFITEHYWGYTKRAGLLGGRGGTGEYGVAHPGWVCYPVRQAVVQAEFGSLYGAAFAGLSERVPDHVLLAEGSAIAIRMGAAF